jgi:hypothetical protein
MKYNTTAQGYRKFSENALRRQLFHGILHHAMQISGRM